MSNFTQRVAVPYQKDEAGESAQSKLRAIICLLDQMKVKCSTFKDYFGGIGIQSEAVLGHQPITKACIQEMDDQCLTQLVRRFHGRRRTVTVRKQDFFTDPCRQRVDLSLFDPNNFTLLQWNRQSHLREAMTRAIDATRLYFLLTDIASAKLWLNYASYGCSTKSLDEYWSRLGADVFEPLGFEFVAAAGRTEAMYVLFRRFD